MFVQSMPVWVKGRPGDEAPNDVDKSTNNEGEFDLYEFDPS